MKNVIECFNLWKVYNPNTPAEVQALRGINMEIKEGEMVGIMGASGSGKSTLLNLIGALDKPTKGKIFIAREDIQLMNENQLAVLRRKRIGFVFQFFNLIGSLTALQNVELPMIFNGLSQAERIKRAKELLAEVGLEDKMNQKPNKLSGGETQRVAIARTIANDPTIILADEPTGNLDSKSGQNVMQTFRKLNKDNRTVIIVTHNLKIAKQTKRVIKVSDGKITDDIHAK